MGTKCKAKRRRTCAQPPAAGSPFAVTIYKLGDAYYGARSNDFGYANYQILPNGPANLVDLKKGELQEEDKNMPAPGVPDKQ